MPLVKIFETWKILAFVINMDDLFLDHYNFNHMTIKNEYFIDYTIFPSVFHLQVIH